MVFSTCQIFVAFLPYTKSVEGEWRLKLIESINKYEGTMDQELYTWARWVDIMAAILKVWRHIRNVTVNWQVLPEEQSCQISSQSDLKRWSLRLFLKSVAPTRIRRRWVTIWHQFLIQESKSSHSVRCWLVVKFNKLSRQMTRLIKTHNWNWFTIWLNLIISRVKATV